MKELSASIANAVSADDEVLAARHTEQLFVCLDELEAKYGEHPSILATRADYIEAPEEHLSLLMRAYGLAQVSGDRLNETLVASSLAELHIEDRQDLPSGKRWLSILRECLKRHPDPAQQQELERLSRSVAALESKQTESGSS